MSKKKQKAKHTCVVCGEPVDPKIDVMLRVGKKNLTATHAGRCTELARTGVVVARDLVEARYPIVRGLRNAVSSILETLKE